MRKRRSTWLLAACTWMLLVPMSVSAEEIGKEQVYAEAAQEDVQAYTADVLAEFPLDALTYSSLGAQVHVQYVDEVPFLFLPASADSSKLVLTCTLNEGERLYVAGDRMPDGVDATEGFDLASIAAPDEGQYAVTLTIRAAGEDGSLAVQTDAVTVQVMQSANFSAIYLTHADGYQGKEYVDASKSNAIEGHMVMVTASGDVVYDNSLKQIKARGNSTFTYYPKKSYQIKLEKKTALIEGTKKGKTWVLLAGYADAVKLSDQMWKDVGAAVGADYTAKAERVDLYFDGEYCGTYTLSEKNQLNSSRIDITDMEEAYEACNEGYGENPKTSSATNRFGNKYYYTKNLTAPAQKGGFLFEFNDVTGDEASWFKTSAGFAVNVKSPEYVDQETMIYVSEYFQEFEDAIFYTDSEGNHTGQNPDTGLYYYDYCNMDSLVEQYLLNCVSSNRDAFWHSLYFYMDTDGVLYAGPLWDMELTLGVGWNNSISPDQDWLADNDANGEWSEALIQIPGFRKALAEAYQETYQDVLRALLGDEQAQAETGLLSIEERAQLGRASVAMDQVLWPDNLKDGSPCALYAKQSYVEYYLFGQKARFRLWSEDTTYDEIVAARVQWLKEHKEFLDGYFVLTEGDAGTGRVTPDVGDTFTSGNLIYQVTKKDQSVMVVKATETTLTSVVVPDVVCYEEIEYEVDAIADQAFKLNLRLKQVTIGKHVTSIGSSAFYGAVSLRTITISSDKLTSVGKNAFRGIYSRAKIQVPADKLEEYQAILKNKGQGSRVSIVAM